MDPGFPTCWGCVFVIMAKNANWATMLIFNIFKKTFLIIFLMQPNSLNSWNNTHHEMFLPQSKLLTLTIQYLIYFAFITTSLCIYKLVSLSFLCLISLRSLFLFFIPFSFSSSKVSQNLCFLKSFTKLFFLHSFTKN